MSKQDRNKGNVTALVFGSSQFIGDKTPTPTRLIRDCEEIGLFDDLQKANLFEESFRRRVELGSNHQPPSKVNTSKGDVLLTPTIFAATADSASDLSMGAGEISDRLLTKDSLLAAECYHDQKFGIKETSMTDSDMSDVSSTKTASSVQPLDDSMTILDGSFSGSTVISQPLELSDTKLKLKSSIMMKSAGKNILGVKSKVMLEEKEKFRLRTATHSSDPELSFSSDKEQLLKRERNRVAAMRSRRKRKTWVEQLEKSAGAMQMLNTKLQTEVTCLRAEVAQLKTLLLAHKDCPVTKAMTQGPEPAEEVEQVNGLEQLIPEHFLAQLERNTSESSETANSKLRVLLQQKLNNSKPVEIIPTSALTPAVISSTTPAQQLTSSTLSTTAQATQSIVVVVKTPNSSVPVKKMTLSNCDLDKFIPVIKCNPNAVAVKSKNSGCESFLRKATPKTKS